MHVASVDSLYSLFDLLLCVYYVAGVLSIRFKLATLCNFPVDVQ